ncbi:unnamed protein product, partial [Schistosoma curassoni]|uniref:Reverse transcriptase domain-containing protein n=1 Tax=Schistosoma curassoni TaxID=6186 RepID=A0A183KT81_9TREM
MFKTNSSCSFVNYETQLIELSRIERHLTYYNRILEHVRGAAIESLCRILLLTPSFIETFLADLSCRIFNAAESDRGVDLLPGKRLLDLEYADDIVLLCNNAQAMQSPLNQLAINVRRYGMCFAPLKCKVLLQDWQNSNPVLTLDGEQIEVVEKFVYLGSCISAGGGVSDEINTRIVKARAAYANLGHLWRLRDVSLAVKGRICNAS